MHREMLTRQHDQLALFDEAGLARAPSPDRCAPAAAAPAAPPPPPRYPTPPPPPGGSYYPALEANFDLDFDDGAVDEALFDFLNA